MQFSVLIPNFLNCPHQLLKRSPASGTGVGYQLPDLQVSLGYHAVSSPNTYMSEHWGCLRAGSLESQTLASYYMMELDSYYMMELERDLYNMYYTSCKNVMYHALSIS